MLLINRFLHLSQKIQAKGYDFQTAERLARNIFSEFAARPKGLSIEARIERILDHEEWVREYEGAEQEGLHCD